MGRGFGRAPNEGNTMSELSGVIEDLSISIDAMTRESILTNQLLLALVIHQVGGEREAVLKVLPGEVRHAFGKRVSNSDEGRRSHEPDLHLWLWGRL